MITLDGLADDWTAAERLDFAGSGVPGYAIYGVSEADAFFFAIETDSVAIGQDTTIWLDTDLDRSTGYQIWGFTGGVEYNVNVAEDGSVALYTGGAGETFVASLNFAYSADGQFLEFEVPKILLAGSPNALRVFADVNNSVYLPNDYSNINFVVSDAVAQPPAVYGTVTIDGDLGDWDPAARLDTPATGTAGYALYGDAQGPGLVFAMQADAVAIGANSTIWLDTDLDRATGYQIWGFAGGAEYNVNIAADGSAALYTGGAGQTFVGAVDWGYSADGQTIEIGIDSALIGGANSARIFADVNDAAYLPNDYANVDLIVGGTPPGPPPVYGTVTIDGDLGDWDPAARLDTPATGTAGYALYGDAQGPGLVFAMQADAVTIGANSTIWLDTDLDRATGYQIWGFAGGAEYNVNIAADGSAALYTGGAGQTFVGAVDWGYSADGQTIEIGIDSALVGGANSARIFADVNDAAFLPNDYANMNFIVDNGPPPSNGPGLRVGIVYSETTANNFYDLTAYGQLFMAAQHQAMQTGIPFDVLSESDLLDPNALAIYDALVFPTFSHVQSADLAAIEASLTTATNTYGVSLIAGGNFLTNDETGAAIAGDSYARMKSLLGVELSGFGQTQGVDLVAASGTNPILDGYAAGELVGSYSNVSYLTFADVTGSGEVLFEQVLTDPVSGSFTQSGAIATTTGARNVHFATDAIIGNNNILGTALDWVTQDDTPDVSMTMTRGTSLFFSRNDMDQSQETFDVFVQQPGIYDTMIPILEGWYEQYEFVGSYYVNIGANPPDQFTDWSISGAYYNQLLALESEIGVHSWTHPEDTGLLQADTAEMLAIIDLVDPRNANHVDPWTLTQEQQDILLSSFKFQFEMARYELEQNLGIPITGAAVPGAPEKLETSREIMQYYDYITGGYSGVGAGYFGAFGYLTPNDTQQVYLAPNMSFDFSLIGFQGLSTAEAEAVWAQEYADIMANATAPIISFPWHDYGLTNWDLGDDPRLNYTQQMFEGVVSRAYADGTEFVTGVDLAGRIDSFSQSSIELSQLGNVITAVVTSPDAGNFALHMGASGTIQSVAGWYAYDGDQVFLPQSGGTFEITLGTTADDVTHIRKLPMRADLISVLGNGQDLDFDFSGRGDVEVELASQGSNVIQITGASSAVISSGVATLSFGALANHSASIDYLSTAVAAGTAGAELSFGSTGSDTFGASTGADGFWGNAGADTFVFAIDSDQNMVNDFQTGVDILELNAIGFADAAAAYGAFSETADGLLLTYGVDESILLSGLDFTAFAEGDILLT